MVIFTAVCALVAAVCSVLCLWRLTRPVGKSQDGAVMAEEDKESAQLRENLINLMEYRVGKTEEET